MSLVRDPRAVGVLPRAVVFVEGLRDHASLAALAERRGRDLVAEGISIVSIGGATNIG
ncbi:MAG: TOPRIM nucleotidyl transferase/hydrolase domain-containing protein, partial [Acidimicrobiia bacterium]